MSWDYFHLNGFKVLFNYYILQQIVNGSIVIHDLNTNYTWVLYRVITVIVNFAQLWRAIPEEESRYFCWQYLQTNFEEKEKELAEENFEVLNIDGITDESGFVEEYLQNFGEIKKFERVKHFVTEKATGQCLVLFKKNGSVIDFKKRKTYFIKIQKNERWSWGRTLFTC